jgi:hypothetical protein
MTKKDDDRIVTDEDVVRTDENVVLIEDLAPQGDIKGGASKKIVFGQSAPDPGKKRGR